MARVPFNQRFWFAFPDISRGEWMPMNNILWDFLNKGQLRELYPKFWNFLTVNFRSIWLSFRTLRNFRLNESHIGYIWMLWKLFMEIKFTYRFPTFRMVKNFWLSGKRAWLPRKCLSHVTNQLTYENAVWWILRRVRKFDDYDCQWVWSQRGNLISHLPERELYCKMVY